MSSELEHVQIQKSVMHQPSHVIIVTFRIDELQHNIDQNTMSPYNHDQRLIRWRGLIHGKDKLQQCQDGIM